MVKVQMKPSPSLIYNNLTISDGSLLYAHGRQACCLALNSIKDGPVPVRRIESQHTDMIHSVRASCHTDTTFVVIGTEAGIQVWDRSASLLSHVWSFPEQGDPSSPTALFARGSAINIAADGSVNICFGASTGTLYVMELGEDARFKPPTPFLHHKSPITAVGSAYQSRAGKWTEDLAAMLVTADEEGDVCVWTATSAKAYSVAHTIKGSGVPCVALHVRSGMIVAGRLDGAVQVYGLNDGKLRADIAAHSRFLSAMDIHPTKDVIATAAEDCTIGVWTLPIGGQKASCQLSTTWMHANVCGVAFCGPHSNDLAVVAYDTDELRLFKAA